MKSLKYFIFFLGVRSNASNVECVAKTENQKAFGYLKYDKYELKKCEALLQSDTDFEASSCELKASSRLGLRLVEEIQCKATSTACPSSPTVACKHDGQPPTTTDKFCYYTCTEEILECPTDSPANRNFVDSSAAFCFNQDIDQCEYKDNPASDSSPQLDWSCDRRSCGYLASSDGFTSTLKFDGVKFINEVVAATAPSADFGCKETPHQDSCSCTKDTDTQTTLTCPESAYTSKCDGGSSNCVDNECFKDLPILDSKSDYCSNLIDGYEYCSREFKVRRPCGDLPHVCKIPDGETLYNCECTVAKEEECPDGALWTDADPDNSIEESCDFINLPLESPMSTCEKTCFDKDLSVKPCLAAGKFDATYWQCFDEFTKITVAENSESKYFEAKKMAGNYSDFTDCGSKKCPDGNCQCEDRVEDKATEKCGESYVSQKLFPTPQPTLSPVAKSTTIVPEIEFLEVLEFQCLSYDMDNKVINHINSDLSENAESECKELELPKNNLNAVCPVDETSCDSVIEREGEKDKFGFYSCSCDEQCSYECADSDYLSVFPDKFDSETDIYTTYTCKKDKNIVMIVCTSIFVPLGVAGIAAGVYFFFFHESSEVAPVETDTELGKSTETQDTVTDDSDNKEDTSDTKSTTNNDF